MFMMKEPADTPKLGSVLVDGLQAGGAPLEFSHFLDSNIDDNNYIWFSGFIHLFFSLSNSSQDRLLYLDIAEDFLAKARRFYPPRDEDSDEDTPGLKINLPLLLGRLEALNGAGNEDESEREDGNLSDRS